MQKYIKKIQKLIALAENAGTEAEAQNALARVAEIQAKYNIASSAIDAADFEFIRGTKIDFMQVRREGTMWEWKLAIAVAQYHLGSALMQKHLKKVYFMGKDMNVEVCEYMFDAARTILRNIVSKKFAEYKKQIVDDNYPFTFMELYRMKIAVGREVYIRSWLEGAVEGLQYKFWEERQKMKQESADMKSVIVANDSALRDFIKAQNFGHAKMHSNRACGEAQRDGFDTGNKLNIHAGINSKGEANVTKRLQE